MHFLQVLLLQRLTVERFLFIADAAQMLFGGLEVAEEFAGGGDGPGDRPSRADPRAGRL